MGGWLGAERAAGAEGPEGAGADCVGAEVVVGTLTAALFSPGNQCILFL